MITLFLSLIIFMMYVMIGAALVSWLKLMRNKLPNIWYPIIDILWISMPILLIIGSIFIIFDIGE